MNEENISTLITLIGLGNHGLTTIYVSILTFECFPANYKKIFYPDQTDPIKPISDLSKLVKAKTQSMHQRTKKPNQYRVIASLFTAPTINVTFFNPIFSVYFGYRRRNGPLTRIY